jgi:hypothetical protein
VRIPIGAVSTLQRDRQELRTFFRVDPYCRWKISPRAAQSSRWCLGYIIDELAIFKRICFTLFEKRTGGCSFREGCEVTPCFDNGENNSWNAWLGALRAAVRIVRLDMVFETVGALALVCRDRLSTPETGL